MADDLVFRICAILAGLAPVALTAAVVFME
jgi:hypothetical protein